MGGEVLAMSSLKEKRRGRRGDVRSKMDHRRRIPFGLDQVEIPRLIEQCTYIRTADLIADTLALVPFLPNDVSEVIGIARSGMIPASLLATHLHLPLYSLDLKGGVTHCGHGSRLDGTELQTGKRRRGKVLLVDDTIASSRSMTRAMEVLRDERRGSRVRRAVVYSTKKHAEKAHLVAGLLPTPHWLEWNFSNCGLAKWMAFDLDGVIHGHGGRPMFLPRRTPLAAIVTARLEGSKQEGRKRTEEWLARWGVQYNTLIMGPWETTEEREKRGIVAVWKGEVYKSLRDIELFVESEPGLAYAIARISGKHTLCPRTGEVFEP